MTIPTPAMIGGDFSQLLTNTQIGTDALGRPVYQGAVYNPASTRTVNGQQVRDPYPNNQAPVSQMDPAALKIAQLFPHPKIRTTSPRAELR